MSANTSTNASSSPKQPPRLAPAWGGRNGGSFGSATSPISNSNGMDALAGSGGGGGGRFQALAAGKKSGSSTDGNAQPHSTANSFSLLSDDNDMDAPTAVSTTAPSTNDLVPGSPVVVRRSSAGRTGSASKGRSLADLAASREPNLPNPPTRGHGSNSTAPPSDSAGGGTHTSNSSGNDGGGWIETAPSSQYHKNVVRYTRERLLSMRQTPSDTSAIPERLQHLIGAPVVTDHAQEPVCFDDFDPDEIWSNGPIPGVSKNSSSMGRSASAGITIGGSKPERGGGNTREVHGTLNGTADSSKSNMWRRGVALPPASSTETARAGTKALPGSRSRGGSSQQAYYNREVKDASELWDDPLDLPGSAATAGPQEDNSGPMMDFSAFGTSLDEVERTRDSSTGAGLSTFDLTDMAEATRKFEEQQHRTSTAQEEEDNEDNNGNNGSLTSNKMRYGGTGLTIQSGSGDDVNVFEDFTTHSANATKPDSAISSSNVTAPSAQDSVMGDSKEAPVVTDNQDIAGGGMGQQQDASSRLMQMIGMNVTSSASDAASASAPIPTVAAPSVVSPWGGAPTSIPSSNPWGASTSANTGVPSASIQEQQQQNSARQQQQEDEERQRQQHQAATAAKVQVQAQTQTTSSQLEMILMERIASILEKSWGGRADLHSILSSLHLEDHRVINLVQNVDVLRSLLVRHPHRVSLARQASEVTGQDVVVAGLLMSNAQFAQQQQAQQHQQEQARQLQQLRQKQAQAAAQVEAARVQAEAEKRKQQQQQKAIVITDAPWFYRDPSGNTQGPFGGKEMQQWLQAGYFNGDLPICQGSAQGPFIPLSSIFPDPKLAFQPSPVPSMAKDSQGSSNGAVDLEAKLQHEKQQRLALQEQQRKQAEEETAAAAKKAKEEEEKEHQRQQKIVMKQQVQAEKEEEKRQNAEEEAALQKIQEQNASTQSDYNGIVNGSSSAQLKMLLGMGAASDQVSQQPSTKKVDAGTTVAQSATAPSAWGGASKQGKQSLARSMSEIQEEEARVAAKLSKERQIRGVSSGSGWANVAASGAWSSNVKPGVQTAPGPASVVEQSKSTVAAASTVGLSASSTQALRIKQQARVAAQKKAMAKTQVSAAMQQSRNSNNADTNDNFGEDGKMSPTMEAWCRDQLRKLNNGSDDLTLVSAHLVCSM